MISQKVNGLERRVIFRPAFHKIHSDPKKNFGVHGMEIWMVVIGDKGACHFGLSTGMMLPKTFDYWKATGKGQNLLGTMQMGVDVGYHSKEPIHDFQKENGPNWPTKIRKKNPGLPDPGIDATKEERMAYMANFTFDKIGDTPPNCEYLGVPCYCDGSALLADEWKDIFLEKGDDVIWAMLEENYKYEFESKD